jgi:hypothetical protein
MDWPKKNALTHAGKSHGHPTLAGDGQKTQQWQIEAESLKPNH